MVYYLPTMYYNTSGGVKQTRWYRISSVKCLAHMIFRLVGEFCQIMLVKACATSGKPKARVSVCLTARTKLKPLILLSRKRPLKNWIPPNSVEIPYGTSGATGSHQSDSVKLNEDFRYTVFILILKRERDRRVQKRPH